MANSSSSASTFGGPRSPNTWRGPEDGVTDDRTPPRAMSQHPLAYSLVTASWKASMPMRARYRRKTESFNTPNADGTLPAPSGWFTHHNVAVYDDVLQGLVIKPWLGASLGNGGYVTISETLFSQVFQSAAAASTLMRGAGCRSPKSLSPTRGLSRTFFRKCLHESYPALCTTGGRTHQIA
jgi:hypothetical protein